MIFYTVLNNFDSQHGSLKFDKPNEFYSLQLCLHKTGIFVTMHVIFMV